MAPVAAVATRTRNEPSWHHWTEAYWKGLTCKISRKGWDRRDECVPSERHTHVLMPETGGRDLIWKKRSLQE